MVLNSKNKMGNGKVLPLFAAITGLLAGPMAVRADTSGGTPQQNAAPAATLQVTGSESRFTLSANHADVQDTLKLIFDQANKQFFLDSTVCGQITMRLNDQPLNVTLDAICRQTFLHYRLDVNTGITYFERDETAVRAAFTRLRALDAALRDQLRLMGLGLPADSQLGLVPNGYGALNGGVSGPASPEALDKLNGVAGRAMPGVIGGMRRESAAKARTPAVERGKADANSNAPAGLADSSDNRDTIDLSKQGDLQQFLLTNNFVTFNIARDKPEPVYSVLQNLGQQAKVNILIDPQVPSGSKFTIRGTLSPRPLTEALNILAPYARLDWRWVGSTIFISTTPDFQLFYGEETTPRAGTMLNTGQTLQRSAAPAAAARPEPKPTAKKAEKKKPY